MDVLAWLEAHGLGQYAEVFASNDIDAQVLRTLTADDLKELGIASLGHRKKLLCAITTLDTLVPDRAPALRAAPPETYTPSHLAERILDARALLTGERKHVTVLFADIRGSLEILEGIDPEEASRILDAAIRVMMDAVHRYEGTVNKVMGDGIMALFGAPIAHEDHAVRGCYAALAIQRAMLAQAAEVRGTCGVEISARGGLHSGEVVVRAIGNDLSIDYDAIGQTVHLASEPDLANLLWGAVILFHRAADRAQRGPTTPSRRSGAASTVTLRRRPPCVGGAAREDRGCNWSSDGL